MSRPRLLLWFGVGLVFGCGSNAAPDGVPYDTADYVSGSDPSEDSSLFADDASEAEIGAPRPAAYEGDAPPEVSDEVAVLGDAAHEVSIDTGGSGDSGATFDSGGLTCTDTTVDVDGDESNGCEVTDPLVNRSEASPTKLGVLGACGSYTMVAFSLPSDGRLHTPSGAIGAAPLYWSFFEDASCALGEKPTLGSFAVAAGAPGSYEIVVYPTGGAPDAKCSGTVMAGGSLGPVGCSSAFTSRGLVRVRKLDGAPGTASITFKIR